MLDNFLLTPAFVIFISFEKTMVYRKQRFTCLKTNYVFSRKTFTLLVSLTTIIGGVFLLYLGIEMMRAEVKEIEYSQGKREGFLEGFFIAFLNPKIAVFMLAVLSTVLDPSMSSDTKWFIAIMGMTIDTIWYVLVALLLSNSIILTKIQNNQKMLNQITGVLMISLAIWTAYRLSGI